MPTESLNHQVISPVLARRGLFYPLPLEITGLAGSWGEKMTFQSRRNSANKDFCLAYALLVSIPLLFASACGGGGGETPPTNNPVPTVASLSPSSLTAGAAAQTLTINGTGFLSNSTVTFNGASHADTYLSASQLTISLSTADLATAGSYPVVVTNQAPGGGPSVAFSFTVSATNPVPTVTSLSPSSLTAGATAQTLTINGTGFLATSTVTFNGVAHTPAYVSASQLTISLTTADLASAGSFPVVVTNPAPGGGSSVPVSFTVTATNPIPTISLLAPASLAVGATPQTLTINGTGFLSQSTVTFNGVAHMPTYMSAGQLTISLTNTDFASAGSFPVVVTNPAPGGGSSSSVAFVVDNLLPAVLSVAPSTIAVGSTATQIELTGSNFLPTSTVNLNSNTINSTYVSATQMIATLPAANLSAAATILVVVVNPTPGGGSSNPVSVTVSNSQNDLEPLDESVPVSADSLSYFLGLLGTPTTGSTGQTSQQKASEPLVQESRVSPMTTGPGWSCTPNGPTSTGGICIPNMPLFPQMPPGNDATKTANCGVASYLMVRAFYHQNYNIPAYAEQQITNILQLTLPDPITNDNPQIQLFKNNCGNQCPFYGTTGYPPNDLISDSTLLNACVNRSGAWYGPLCGFGFDQIQEIANKDAFSSSNNLLSSDNPSVTLQDFRQALCPTYPNCSDVTQLHPVIVHVRYEMRELVTNAGTCSQAGLSAMSTCCLKGGQPVPASESYPTPGDPGHCVGHYMVVVGIDDDDTTGYVYVNDPDAGSGGAAAYTAYLTQDFLNSWSSTGSKGREYLVINYTPPPVSIVANSTNIPAAQAGSSFNATVSANYGIPPYQFTASAFPPGLGISSTGTISGIPTGTGTFQSTLQVADSTPSYAQAPVTFSVGPNPVSLTITTPANLTPLRVGVSIASPLQMTAAGGIVPYHWSEGGSTCPSSISGLDGLCVSSGGTIQGTPTTSTNGAVSFALQVTDSSSPPQTVSETINLAVLPANLPPQMYSVAASPSTVSEQGLSTLACTVADPQQLSLSYSWSVTGGTVSGTGASVSWTAPSAPGGYSATCTVTSSAGLSATGSTVIQVSSSALNSSISPTSGTIGVTQFTVNGSGATQNGGVTATITLPNATTTTSHTTANGSGQYSFGPFTESATGVYSEIDSDDKSSGMSLPFSWTVTNSVAPVLSVTPTNAPVSAAAGSTNFSVSNSGTGTLSYSAAVTSGSSWLSIASGATGGNSGTIAVSYASNNGGQRAGTIQITANGASGSPATVTVTQAGVTTSNIRISENQGFDTVLAPSQDDMDTWINSMNYRDIGVYIGGCDASVAPASGIKDACGNVPAQASGKQQNTNLNSSWVGHVSNSGWGIMPLWVGPQSSCITQNPNGNNLIENTIITTAYDLGASEADAAANRASALGMGNSIVYYDMEAYSTGNSSCSATVGQFLSGWVNELHVQGFLAGVYIYHPNFVDMTTAPDAIWASNGDGSNSASDLGIVTSANWSGKEIHQYCVGSQECPAATITDVDTQEPISIDLDAEDGPVFSPVATTTTPVPSISSISPTAMTASPASNPDATQQLTINGTNFQSGDYVQFKWTQGTGAGSWNNGSGNPPTIGAGGAQMTIMMKPGTVTDTFNVQVCNSANTCAVAAQTIAVTAANKFTIGENVKVSGTGSVLNLHSCANTAPTCSVLVGMPDGTVMQVIGGPTAAAGYTWWELSGKVAGISYTGWADQGYLVAD
jgi:hypothetical protein